MMAKTNLIAEPGRQEVVVTRTFDAPCDLVFKAYTNPALISQWWGPREYVTRIDKMEVKPGGLWRFVQSDAAGNEFAFHGFYHEVLPSKRLVFTFEFEGMPGHILLETVTFEDQNGRTKLIDQSVYQSLEDRDGMVSMGMERGATESTERLEELLMKV